MPRKASVAGADAEALGDHGVQVEPVWRSSLARNVVVVIVAPVSALLLAIGPAAAGAVTSREGQGTDENGTCSNVSGSGTVQTWQFILTQPGAGPFKLTAEFTDSGTKTDVGEQSGDGAVHIFVPATRWSRRLRRAGRANSGLTVSDCVLSGEAPPMTTTTPAAAVAAAPTFTG
jgi:hypothetical protein